MILYNDSVFIPRFTMDELEYHFTEEVLGSAPPASVLSKLREWVGGEIEPGGWEAVWRSSLKSRKTLPLTLPRRTCIVEVCNVELTQLSAAVRILDPVVAISLVSVPLTELYQLLVQPNSDTLDIEKT